MEKNLKQIAHNVVRTTVGEIITDNDEIRKMFTDSHGRVHTAVFLDQNTGKPVFY